MQPCLLATGTNPSRENGSARVGAGATMPEPEEGGWFKAFEPSAVQG